MVNDKKSAEEQQKLKRFREMHQQKMRNEKEEEEYQRLLDHLKDHITDNPQIVEEDAELTYVFSENANQDIIEITKDYKEKFNREPFMEGGKLKFPFESIEDANDFFKEQSKKGRAFDIPCENRDHRVYSDGKGVFVQGTKSAVSDYLQNKEHYKIGKDGALTKTQNNAHTRPQKGESAGDAKAELETMGTSPALSGPKVNAKVTDSTNAPSSTDATEKIEETAGHRMKI